MVLANAFLVVLLRVEKDRRGIKAMEWLLCPHFLAEGGVCDGLISVLASRYIGSLQNGG